MYTSINIHNITEIQLVKVDKLEESNYYVNRLIITDEDGGKTVLSIFSTTAIDILGA